MLIDKVRKTIAEHTLIDRGDHIVLGLSGGPDSVCLFHVLKELSKDLDLTIHPVHVNHKFRPGHAERDQEYVEMICREAGTPCRSFVVDCNALAEEEGLTSEEAGRKARYYAFCQVAGELVVQGKTGADDAQAMTDTTDAKTGTPISAERVKIAVAQNANDQAETVLHRLIRGTGPDGLAGIPYSREEKGITVIRPLLDVSRKEIEEFCDSNGLDPVIDHTNSEPVYTRNRIRLELLPLLEEYNTNIIGSLNRLARIAAEDRDYLASRAAKAMDGMRIPAGGELVLMREPLADLSDSIRHRIVKMAFEEIGLDQDITEERLLAADAIIKKKQGPKVVEFPHNYRLKVAAGKVSFSGKY